MNPEHILDEVIAALDSVKSIEGFEKLKDGDPSSLFEDHPNIKNLSPDDRSTVKDAINLTRDFLDFFSNGETGEKDESFQEGISELKKNGYKTSYQRSQDDLNKIDGWVEIENIRFDLNGF